jgi:virulence factor Mce-like protein
LAVAIAIGTVATTASIFSLGSGNNDYTVKVHFPTANGLIDGSDVFIGGVKVGVVNSVVVDPTPPVDNGNSNFANPTTTATATISIGKQYSPLHQGATAAIRPKSLLGEKYVAMTVGDPGKDAIPNGTTLPPEATSVNVELDQLVNVFDAATRKQLQKLIDNLGTGLIGQGRNTNQTFQVGQTDLGNLATVTDVLQARDVELKRIIDALSKITTSLATDQQRANYPDLLKHSDTVLQALIAEDADVAQGIDRMNTFFGILDASFAGRQQDMSAILASLPRTVSDLDALSMTLGPQGHVALGVVQKTAPGVVASDLIFGSVPAKNAASGYTFTSDLYTRVLPSQGCFNVGTRTYDASGFAHDSLTPIRQVCTTPVFAGPPNPCATWESNNLIGGLVCGQDLAGSLCVAFGFNSNPSSLPPAMPGPGRQGIVTQGCDNITSGLGGPDHVPATAGALAPASMQRGVLGLPMQQVAIDPQTANQLVEFLLR